MNHHSETYVLPVEILSEVNINTHWAKKVTRKNTYKTAVDIVWAQHSIQVQLPCVITLTRCSPRFFDDDNLVISFKTIRDRIAQKIFPGTLPGKADNDPRIVWKYSQKKSQKKYAEMTIEPGEDNATQER